MPRASSQQAEAMPDRSQRPHQQQTGLAVLPDVDATVESGGQSETAGESASFRQSSNAGKHMAEAYQFWMFGDPMSLLGGSAEKRKRKRRDGTFWRCVYETPGITPGCSGVAVQVHYVCVVTCLASCIVWGTMVEQHSVYGTANE